MIAKHIPMRAARRSSFSELVGYITHAKDKAVRIGKVRVTNCHQLKAQDAVLEVLATQLQNRRASSDMTYHLLISFPAGEQPGNEAMHAIEDEVCNALGFWGHQRVSAVHTDTDNLHLHVAINKIHPSKRTIHNPFCDYKALGAVCERLQRLHGLSHTNHKTLAPGARNRALDMEYSTGIESLLGWIKRECLEDLRLAQSWGELHRCLGRSGLVLQERGNGLVVHDKEGRVVKASSVARDFSMRQLEKRLGPFESNIQQQMEAERSYQVRPVSRDSDTDVLYRKYLADQAHRRNMYAQTRQELRAQRHSLVSQAKDGARIKRGAIRLLDCGSDMKRMLYQQAGIALRENLQSIHAQDKTQWKENLANAKPLCWFDWLAERAALHDSQALAALRKRQRIAFGRANALLDVQQKKERDVGTGINGVRIDSVTKQGTLIYAHGKSAIRDSGRRLEVSEGIKQDALEIALAIAMKRFGRSIAIQGDAVFRERVLHTARALQFDIRFDGEVRAESRDLRDRDEDAGKLKNLLRAARKPINSTSTSESAGKVAAQRYIAERELKRQAIAGIPRHVLGDLMPGRRVQYAGWRRVDGQYLLLVQNGTDEIAVIPVEPNMIGRISGLKRGQPLMLENEGVPVNNIRGPHQKWGMQR